MVIDMPRPPERLQIERIVISPDAHAQRVNRSARNTIPDRFRATVYLTEPKLVLDMVIRIAVGGQPRVSELQMECHPGESITTSLMRQVPIDTIVRRALGEASLPRVPIDQSGDRVERAALVYRQAVSAGSYAPTEAVAAELGYSRSHAARLVGQARDRGLLGRTSPGRTAA